MVIGLTLAGTALSDAASIVIDSSGTISVAEPDIALAKYGMDYFSCYVTFNYIYSRFI